MSEECQAYIQGRSICANGFFQTLPCRKVVKCFMCGKPSPSVPHCMKEELPDVWITDEGKPRFLQSK